MEESFKKKKNKGTKPRFIKHEGTYYRVILTITSEVLKETYLRTMSKRSQQDLDSANIPYHNEWKVLAEYYNSRDHKELDNLGGMGNIGNMVRMKMSGYI